MGVVGVWLGCGGGLVGRYGVGSIDHWEKRDYG